jgi:hypothetical protein
MAIVYDVFAGSQDGGPVDYTTPLLSTGSLSATIAAVAPGSSQRFAVRARDTATGLSDGNTDANALVTIGNGLDLSSAPPAPQALRVFAGPNGQATAEWAYPFLTAVTLGFRVYLWRADRPDLAFASVVAVVPFRRVTRTLFTFRCGLAGLLDGVSYRVGVRAYNGHGEEQNTVEIGVTGKVLAPANVATLSAVASY